MGAGSRSFARSSRPLRTSLLVVTCALAVVAHAVASERPAPPTAADLARDVATLAAPEMEGRGSGTAGGDRAAREIARWLEAAGLEPGGDGGTFFQSVVIATGVSLAPPTHLDLISPEARRLDLERDWRPHGGSPDADVTAGLVFVGYGIERGTAGWNDYDGVDARDRIAVVLDGAPPRLGTEMVTRLEKVITARRHGAAALLIVSAELPALATTGTHVRLPSASLTREAADALLAPSGRTVAELTKAIGARGAPVSFTIRTGSRE